MTCRNESGDTTVGKIIASHATRRPNAPAIVCPDLELLSFGDLARYVQLIGNQLSAAGVSSNSRIGIALSRGPAAAILSIAACCNAILVPLNPSLSNTDLEAELTHLRLDALIVSNVLDLHKWNSWAGDECGLFTVAKSDSSRSVDVALEQVRPVGRRKQAPPPTADSWAGIFRTSGTTGTFKRVPVTHGNLLAMANKMQRWLQLTDADRSACIMPLYYNAGFKATLLAPLLIGCSVALPGSTQPRDCEQWLSELQPTWLTAAPPFLQAVLENLRAQVPQRPVSSFAPSLRFVLSTASYLPPSIGAELQNRLGLPVVEFYGLCEAGMMTAPIFPPETARPGSVGRAPHGELAIQNNHGAFLGPGEAGEIMVRGPSVTPGYLVGDIDGIPTGLENGWLPTGDIGIVDSDGVLTVTARRKELINRGGEKISPYDVEKALLAHPAVREAAVFALPHSRLGETVGAAVVLHIGASLSSTELIAFVSDRLAPFQLPRHIEILESLPIGVTGKISRAQLSRTFVNVERPTERPGVPLEMLIANIWQRLLNRTNIGIEDDFFEIGGDSLLLTEMLLELEASIHHRVPPSAIRIPLTILHLAQILACEAAAKQEVITRVKSGVGTPLFLFHGDYLHWGLYGYRLSDLLKGDVPVYLLHSVLDSTSQIETIEDMVQQHLPHVETMEPNGPIRLAGFCHGGHAALELAYQLESRGRAIESVVLIDTLSINARPFMRFIVSLMSRAGRMVPGALGSRIRRDAILSLWLLSQLLKGDRKIGRVARMLQSGAVSRSIHATYYRAMSQYVPPKVRAEVVCLVCEEYSAKWGYRSDPWKNLCTNVRQAQIPGGHHSCIVDHMGELATCLNGTLQHGDISVDTLAVTSAANS
jgi:acyl-CoA synthetase (AMP-forming)/AMP-acid ligase II/thioesterase domain-containing protein